MAADSLARDGPATNVGSKPQNTPEHREPAKCAVPSAVSITLRICREIHRCYDAAVRIAESQGPQGFGSGGTTRWGESPELGVAQLFQREPVS